MENKLYIDKTEYVYRLAHTNSKYYFLNRPRRFGKSLLVTTLQSYFESKKDLFKGLAIEHLEKEWTEYPVLHFDMSGGKHMDKEQLDLYLGYMLEDIEKVWGISMRNFYSPLKYCEQKLRFVFLTGITKFSQVSIFSELNNIANISMNKDYAGICGITNEESPTGWWNESPAALTRPPCG